MNAKGARSCQGLQVTRLYGGVARLDGVPVTRLAPDAFLVVFIVQLQANARLHMPCSASPSAQTCTCCRSLTWLTCPEGLQGPVDVPPDGGPK